jgi:hypothetical protein
MRACLLRIIQMNAQPKKDNMVVIAPIDKGATIQKAFAVFHLLCDFRNYPHVWQTKAEVLLCSSSVLLAILLCMQ